jgi:hypothetical protein
MQHSPLKMLHLGFECAREYNANSDTYPKNDNAIPLKLDPILKAEEVPWVMEGFIHAPLNVRYDLYKAKYGVAGADARMEEEARQHAIKEAALHRLSEANAAEFAASTKDNVFKLPKPDAVSWTAIDDNEWEMLCRKPVITLRVFTYCSIGAEEPQQGWNGSIFEEIWEVLKTKLNQEIKASGVFPDDYPTYESRTLAEAIQLSESYMNTLGERRDFLANHAIAGNLGESFLNPDAPSEPFYKIQHLINFVRANQWELPYQLNTHFPASPIPSLDKLENAEESAPTPLDVVNFTEKLLYFKENKIPAPLFGEGASDELKKQTRLTKYLKMKFWTPEQAAYLVSGIAPDTVSNELYEQPRLNATSLAGDLVTEKNSIYFDNQKHVMNLLELDVAPPYQKTPKGLFVTTPTDFVLWCKENGVDTTWLAEVENLNSPITSAPLDNVEHASNVEEDENITPNNPDDDEVLANLFDPVPVTALEKMFSANDKWKGWAERAARNGLSATRTGRGKFNPYKAGVWFVHQGNGSWDMARLYRVLANNLPARSSDSKHLLTGDNE